MLPPVWYLGTNQYGTSRKDSTPDIHMRSCSGTYNTNDASDRAYYKWSISCTVDTSVIDVLPERPH